MPSKQKSIAEVSKKLQDICYQSGVEVTKTMISRLLESEVMTEERSKELLEKIDITDPFGEARRALEKETNKKNYLTI